LFGQAYHGAALSYANEVAAFAATAGHPLMVAESTPRGNNVRFANAADLWSAWYAPVIGFIEQHDVKAWSYINANWDAQPMWANADPPWGDSRIESNPDMKALWLAEMAKPRYLQASPTLFSTLGYP
jgi:hypothetical protein